eukprot:scaffold34620_cov69-Phaeocystis_antarctica.AAC.4
MENMHCSCVCQRYSGCGAGLGSASSISLRRHACSRVRVRVRLRGSGARLQPRPQEGLRGGRAPRHQLAGVVDRALEDLVVPLRGGHRAHRVALAVVLQLELRVLEGDEDVLRGLRLLQRPR